MTDDESPEAQIRRLTVEAAEALQLAQAGERLYREILESVKTRAGGGGAPDVAGLAKDLNRALTRYAPAAAELRRRSGGGDGAD
ncbi:MAG: hypothetical protein NXI21_16430 [Alphaproteobacteria bacterium]|nr:hypothetical protein [Alphaproteobacteria bacterium]